ncbi:MAG: pyrroline-5-carboxylate reductase [Acidimicrobiales bacterium]|nr:pyrroline-5-carboxylate reductase [Acidimicrobiales bacterium]
MSSELRLQVIGGGKMGEALIGGLLADGWARGDEVAVLEKLPERRSELAARFPELVLIDAPVDGVDALLAVKPQDVDSVGASLGAAGVRRLLSIAAGVTTARLEALVGGGVAVVRAMPNTPALVGQGAAAIAGGAAADDGDLEWARGILSSVGLVVALDEAQLDAVTGLSGSGPAYVFLVAEALVAGGIAVGLDPAVADALTRQTLLGAARLLAETGEDPAVLRANVTSPGGTTAEGLAALDAAGVRAAFAQAVRAATERSVELGRS